jgi:hypothetical protein
MRHEYGRNGAEHWRLDLRDNGDVTLQMNANVGQNGVWSHRVRWEGGLALVSAYEQERLKEGRPRCLVFEPIPLTRLVCNLELGMVAGTRFVYDLAMRQLGELMRLLQLPAEQQQRPAARLWEPRDGFSQVATALVDIFKDMTLTHELGYGQEKWDLSDQALRMCIRFKDLPADPLDYATTTKNYLIEWSGWKQVAERYLLDKEKSAERYFSSTGKRRVEAPSLVRFPFVIGQQRAAEFTLTLTQEAIMRAPRAFFGQLQRELLWLIQSAVDYNGTHSAFPEVS